MCPRERFTNLVPSSSLTQSDAGAHLHVQLPTANRELASFLQGRLVLSVTVNAASHRSCRNRKAFAQNGAYALSSGQPEDNHRPRQSGSESGISPVHQNLDRLPKPSASQSPKLACSQTPASCPQVYTTATRPLSFHCRSMDCAGERTPCCSERKTELAQI